MRLELQARMRMGLILGAILIDFSATTGSYDLFRLGKWLCGVSVIVLLWIQIRGRAATR